MPRLNIERSGNVLRLSWPATAADYVLESNQHLSTGSWIPTTDTPSVEGDLKVIIITISDLQGFYRLRRP